ncbi:MAG: hypothetical protein K5669_07365 [Lachnospiraceae bacterium]|nr:hypothetical protein [Lachnospiraceae bacterium]
MMITSTPFYIENDKEVIPSWMKLERLEYCDNCTTVSKITSNIKKAFMRFSHLFKV